jgi:hypothetical protein
MSMYNMMFGVNPAAQPLLQMVGFTGYEQVGRFRDVYVIVEDGEPVIAVYTRNGGGNRIHYRGGDDDNVLAGPECDCVGCIMTYRLPRLPAYIRDEDDSFDGTYATVYFRLPDPLPDVFEEGVTREEVREILIGNAIPEGDLRPGDSLWRAALKSMTGQE